jgi:hypothetical protein
MRTHEYSRGLYRNCVCLFLCLHFAFLTAGVGAADLRQSAALPEEISRIENLTHEILRKELDLERFYLLYRVIGTKEPKFRRLRYYLLQVASAGCTLSSNIMFLKLAADGLKPGKETDFGIGDAHPNGDENSESAGASANAMHEGSVSQTVPEKNTDGFARRALTVGMIGTILDVTSSVVELCSNSFTAAKNVQKGRSPSAIVKKVISRIKDIDTLAAERNAIVEAHPNMPANSVYKAEGRVLKCFRNWCLSEFADLYAEVKSTQSSYNVYYLLDVTADSLYLASYLYSYKALDLRRARLGGPALIEGIIGDCFTTIAGPASSHSYTPLYNYWRKKLQGRMKESLKDNEDDTKAEMTNLNRELASADEALLQNKSSLLNRVSIYILWSERYDRYIDKQIIELHHQSKVALQGEISGPAIGSTYLAQSLLGTIGYYHYPNKPGPAAKLALAATIPSTAGTSASLLLTNWNLLDEMMHRRLLRKQNLLPEQLLAGRLKTLDELEAKIPPATTSGDHL